jgi:predicted branched-subunit amino acid permease
MSRAVILQPTTTTARVRTASHFADGARAVTPMVLGVVPFGIAIGAAAAKAHMPTLVGLSGSIFLLGGSAQLAVIQLLDAGAAAAVAITAALLINARLLVYGAGLAPWFRDSSARDRMLLALPIVDQLYLLSTTEYADGTRDESARKRFFAGAAVHLWLAFIAAQLFGALVGNGVPAWLGLQSATPISLAALLAVAVKNRRGMQAAIGAGLVMALTSSLNSRALLLLAILVGIACGLPQPRSAKAAS